MNTDRPSTLKRSYNRVSEDQKSIFIDIMKQVDFITIKDASDLLNINYESAKAIWTIYRKKGRKQNLTVSRRDKKEKACASYSGVKCSDGASSGAWIPSKY